MDTLEELIAGVRENLLTFATDQIYHPGYTGDPVTLMSPVASVSITRQINRAIRDIATATGFYIESASVPIDTANREYAIDQDWLGIRSVYLNSIRLRKTTISELDRREPAWRNQSGVPQRYYLMGSSLIGLDRLPQASGSLTVIASKSPPVLANLTDRLANYPSVYAPVIVTRASMYCAQMDAASSDAKDRAAFYAAEYDAAITQMVAFFDQRGGVDDDAPLLLLNTGAGAGTA